MKQREKKEVKPKSPPAKKIFFIGVGAAALGYGMYELYKRMSGQNEPSPDTDLLPEPAQSTITKSVAVRNDRFPLKRGSLGSNVRLMQLGLQKILGEAELAKFTPVNGNFADGDFGPLTQGALIQAGFPTRVDEPTFLKIIQGVNKSVFDSDPKAMAVQLYRYAAQKNVQGVLSVLGQLKSTSDYSALNDLFKQVTEEKTMVTSTIVTYLLNKSFANDSSAKEQIKTEFRRMGLLEKSDGKWALSGIRIYKDIQTLVNTFVNDAVGMTILVDKGTILGEELKVSNGKTTFKALDGRLYKVSSKDVGQIR